MSVHDGSSADNTISELRAALERSQRDFENLSTRFEEQNALINMNPETGLPIFRLFYRDVDNLIHAAAQEAPGGFAIVQLRLDAAYQRIKHTKDRSHALLFKSTIRIREETGESLYQSDRLDEFFMILRDYADLKELFKRLAEIVRAVAQPHEGITELINFGCHLGCAWYPEHGTQIAELLMNAEIALRYAVHRQRPVIGYTEALGRAYDRISRIEQELHKATQTGFDHFHLVYQPFVDSGHVIRGCESLIRWDHPELGAIPPPQFIPVAERMGEIRIFGRWILYKSCLQLREWQRMGYDELFVSVNLSPLQFNQRDLVEQVVAVLESTGLEGRHLKLEITEGALMSDPEDAVRKLNELRRHGIRISIDDFGTGYSSLSYLRKLPIDTLKIDKSFIDDVTNNDQNRQIVRAIISLAQSLNLETLAEGVETLDQKELILNEGCKYIQGYYFSKPVKPERFNDYLRGGATLPPAEA